jgi:hypothetical protein
MSAGAAKDEGGFTADECRGCKGQRWRYKERVRALQRTIAGVTMDKWTSASSTKDECRATKDECRRYNGRMDECKLYKGQVQALQRTSAGAAKDECIRYKGRLQALQRKSAGATKDECRRYKGPLTALQRERKPLMMR